MSLDSIMAPGAEAAASSAAAQGTGPIGARREPAGDPGIGGTAELRPDGDDTEFGIVPSSADRARTDDLEVSVEDREDVVACGAIRR